jgi:phosphoglycolate phosphatase
MNYKAVLFDFDYTLGDSTAAILVGFQGGMTAMGHPAPTEEQVRPTVGMTLQNAYTLITGDETEEKRQEFFRHFQDIVGKNAVARGDRTMVEKTVLFPGTEELLTALKERGIPAGIVSTKTGSIIREIFAFRQLSHLLCLVVGGEHVTRPKPDPQGLLGALDELGLAPEEVLFCGDTVIDAQTAQAAGTPFCAVLNGTTPAAAFADYPHEYIAPHLDDLRLWLEL